MGASQEHFADRRRAVGFTLSAVGPQNIVLIAGTGSEPCQIVGDVLLASSDMATGR